MPELYAEIVFPIPLESAFTYSVPLEFQKDIKIGQRVLVPFRNYPKVGFVIRLLSDINQNLKNKVKPVKKIIDTVPFLTPELLSLAAWMKKYYFSSLGEALSMIFPSSYTGELKKTDKPLIAAEQKPVLHQLTDEQQYNFQQIQKNVHQGKFASYLLFGVTGSGKTEIYSHLIKEVIELNKSVIFLLPEISLSAQIVQYLLHVFSSDLIAVLHSRMTKKQKILEWQRILNKEKKIIIGPRSALFAPVENLGLIIIDEEHSSTYKEHARPKYNARQVAYFRAKHNKAVLLLGSATPSLESFYLAQKGFFHLLSLPNRINNRAMPSITVLKNNSFQNILHPDLVKKINEKLEKKEQIIVFYNHRGFSNFYYCTDCGHIFKCPHCSVSLTYHRTDGKDQLECHFCGYNQSIPDKCPECQSVKLSSAGAGTQKIELILKKYFPEARIQRYDFDSTSRKGSGEKIYKDFVNQKIDIIVGTQMVAKGLHFPNVTLVGVVGFDNMVNLPDFRSFENTFSTLIQVAGRTGRADKNGEVIIQTIDDHHPLVPFIKKHSYEFFYQNEIKNRKMLSYPPFVRLIRILVRSKEEKKAEQVIQTISGYLKKTGADMRILGPAPAPYGKLHNQYRFHLILKISKRTDDFEEMMRNMLMSAASSSVHIDIDPDPVSLL